MIRLLLIDDHLSFRVPLATILSRENDIQVVGQADNIADTLELIEKLSFNTALVDLSLPDGSGLDVIPVLARSQPNAAIIMLTGVTQAATLPLAIAAGAVGYLSKTVDIDEIVYSLRRINQGRPLIAPVEAMRLVRQAAEYQERETSAGVAISHLSPRELEVLRGLATGMDNHAIAVKLNLSTNTIRSHVAHVLTKLGVQSRLQAALLAVQLGAVDTPCPPSPPIERDPPGHIGEK